METELPHLGAVFFLEKEKAAWLNTSPDGGRVVSRCASSGSAVREFQVGRPIVEKGRDEEHTCILPTPSQDDDAILAARSAGLTRTEKSIPHPGHTHLFMACVTGTLVVLRTRTNQSWVIHGKAPFAVDGKRQTTSRQTSGGTTIVQHAIVIIPTQSVLDWSTHLSWVAGRSSSQGTLAPLGHYG